MVKVMEYKKNTFCSCCGTRFTEQDKWPRTCFHCYGVSYSNPLPVVIAILPVLSNQLGVLIIKRDIEPHKGGWALPGGYMDNSETWQQACAREVMEEVGMSTDINHYRLMDVTSSQNGNLLIFGSYSLLTKKEDISFQPNHEVSDIDIIYSATELCFPTHTEMIARYFNPESLI